MTDLQEVLEKLLPGLCDIFGDVLKSVILYGSAARGTATSESDVDIAVIVHEYTKEMHDRMIDLTVELELEYDKVLSLLLIDYDHFWNGRMFFRFTRM